MFVVVADHACVHCCALKHATCGRVSFLECMREHHCSTRAQAKAVMEQGGICCSRMFLYLRRRYGVLEQHRSQRTPTAASSRVQSTLSLRATRSTGRDDRGSVAGGGAPDARMDGRCTSFQRITVAMTCPKRTVDEALAAQSAKVMPVFFLERPLQRT